MQRFDINQILSLPGASVKRKGMAYGVPIVQLNPVAQVTTLCTPARAQEGGCSILEHLCALWLSFVSPIEGRSPSGLKVASVGVQGGQRRTKGAPLWPSPLRFGHRLSECPLSESRKPLAREW